MSSNLDVSILNSLTEESDNPVLQDEKQYLINNVNYALLQQCQQAIAKATDISPSIRKLINDLITPESLDMIKNKLIAQFSD